MDLLNDFDRQAPTQSVQAVRGSPQSYIFKLEDPLSDTFCKPPSSPSSQNSGSPFVSGVLKHKLKLGDADF